jgi:hypothetical protein
VLAPDVAVTVTGYVPACVPLLFCSVLASSAPQANNASSGTKRSRARPNSVDMLQFKNTRAAINAKAHSQDTAEEGTAANAPMTKAYVIL